MKRWLLWTFYCRRGRLCADLVIDDFESNVPPGSILRLGYECHGCGTVYELTYLVGADNALIATGRERVAHPSERHSGGVVVHGGESVILRHSDDDEDAS